MNKRPVDTTKKSNIKCEHCKHWDKEHMKTITITQGYFHIPTACPVCDISEEPKWYYNRCKRFEWREEYLDED